MAACCSSLDSLVCWMVARLHLLLQDVVRGGWGRAGRRWLSPNKASALLEVLQGSRVRESRSAGVTMASPCLQLSQRCQSHGESAVVPQEGHWVYVPPGQGGRAVLDSACLEASLPGGDAYAFHWGFSAWVPAGWGYGYCAGVQALSQGL